MRTEAAKIGRVGLQIIRDWVLHFNERGPDGLLNDKSPGRPSKLNDVQRQAIACMIESGIPAVHGVVRWRLIDLTRWIFEEFRITLAKQTLSGNCAPWLPPALCTAAPLRATARSRILKSFPTRVETIARAKATCRWAKRQGCNPDPTDGLRQWAHGF
jgi:hypothetical protein